MLDQLARHYYRITLGYPWVVAGVVVVLLVLAGFQARHFHLDASAESLMIEGDEDMHFYREIRARYGSDDFLIVTYSPHEKDLFAEATLERIRALRDELAGMERVDSVTTLLDVPLIDSPAMTLSEIQRGTRTLMDEDTDRDLAREEFLTSPLYRDLIINPDADTTALLVSFRRDEQAHALLQRREMLRVKQEREGLDADERSELRAVEAEYGPLNERYQRQMEADIAEARQILDRHREYAQIFLGGVPMIAVDMMDFVRSDISTFGVGVALFIVLLLAFTFQRLRWVIIPSLICGGVALGMTGFLGFMSWPVTVVSSNFISLVLIITLSLIVHLVVRHRELHMAAPDKPAAELVRETIDSKFKPSFYTALTTMVAFASMMFAEIRPVMDFGLMMVFAVAMGFVLTFVLFPALVSPFAPGRVPVPRRDYAGRMLRGFARLVQQRAALVWVLFAAIGLAGIVGMGKLTVENRFIDYFKSDTEIYQGMELIDRELGGTTPLDVVLDATPDFLAWEEEEDDEFAFEFEGDAGPVGGYWFDPYQLEEVKDIHDYLESLPETGKVLSVGTSMRMIQHLNRGEPLDPFGLGLVYQQIPDELRDILFDPYMSGDGNQIRIDIRVIDSDPNLHRDALLRQIRGELISQFDLEPEQVRLSGMLVLYNNVMQSLISSQFVTMFIVFGAIMAMFGLLFRSLRMALIGPLPTLVAAVSVLGLLGWLGIPLDIMTMTIAAITIGIGVHDTIHYSDRFRLEILGGADYPAAMLESHTQVGRAMFYTTVIITAGFSILMLSNFIPTIYFGLFTGVAMVFALISNLTLLPLLMARLRPF